MLFFNIDSWQVIIDENFMGLKKKVIVSLLNNTFLSAC